MGLLVFPTANIVTICILTPQNYIFFFYLPKEIEKFFTMMLL